MPRAAPAWRRGALVVNSGNANAFTGWRGRETVEATAAFAGEAAACDPDRVFIASTGVIGEPLDAGKFKDVLKDDRAAAPAKTSGPKPRAPS